MADTIAQIFIDMDGNPEIISGQHRFLAALAMGVPFCVEIIDVNRTGDTKIVQYSPATNNIEDTAPVVDKITAMKDAYKKAKAAPVGSKVVCPTCGKTHTKTTYHKVFCSNQKTGGATNCKDRYWNTVDEKRRVRAEEFAEQEVETVVVKKSSFEAALDRKVAAMEAGMSWDKDY